MNHSKITVEITHNEKPDILRLINLYSIVGWNQDLQRTAPKINAMLEKSLHFICAYYNHELIGFGRILGDPFIAQLVDVITHPNCRVMRLLDEIKTTHSSVIVIDGSEVKGFYEKFGF